MRTRLNFTCNTSSCVHPPFVYRDKFFFPGVVIFIQFHLNSSCMLWRTEPNTWYREIESPNPYATRPDRFFTLCSSRIERECSSLWHTSGWIHADSKLTHPCFPEPNTCSCLCNSCEVVWYSTVLSVLSYRNYEGNKTRYFTLFNSYTTDFKVTDIWTSVFCDVTCSGSWAILMLGVELGLLVD